MRPISTVAREICSAWWKALNTGGGTHEQRFSTEVDKIVAKEIKRVRQPRPRDIDAPSSQTTVINLKRREQLVRAGVQLPSQPTVINGPGAAAAPEAARAAR